MTNEYHGPDPDTAPDADGWQPLPQGDYDSDATAFVQLPPEGFPDAPLAAPGHGYVPPQITVSPASGAAATDPAATGVWVLPPELTGVVAAPYGAEPEPGPGPGPESYGFPQGGDTGQWSIPVADGELPDESGEYTTSALASHWGDRTPPATLPGGAPAPWASEPWAQPAAPVAEPETGPEAGPEAGPFGAPEAEPEVRPGAEPEARPEPEQEPEPQGEPEPQVAAASEEAASEEAASEEAASEEAAQHAPEPGHEAPRTETAAETETAETESAAVTEVAGENEVVGEEAAAEPGPAPDPDPDSEPASAPVPLHDDHPMTSYVLRVNGTDRPVTDAWIGESLLYVLRERLGLAGAKDGCSQGECGACNVQVDGRLVASCLVPAATTAGSEVRTVEGLAEDGRGSDVQRALAACGAVQCGFCVPGMAMTVHDLLEGNPNPTDLEARQALCGNLCRCSGYRGVLDAVRQVADARQASQHAAAEPAEAEQVAEDGPPLIPHQGGPASSEDIQDSRDGGRA
ncbi:(2Fe-2S)-binding protein [Streptomyces sp. NPDC016845]|uniref:(2Fe-2S)-binding protein n=1 Tax=Streptomyces sp. NPDC016845 TaxID=3364972 RepID=UPI00378E36FF